MSRTLDGVGAVGVRGIRRTTSAAKGSKSRARTSSSVANKVRQHNPPAAINRAATSKSGIQRRKV
jgi:hypothetical protein